MAGELDLAQRSETKQVQGEHVEIRKPLAAYNKEELNRMILNFYSVDLSYHMARHHFPFGNHTPGYAVTWRCIAR